MKIAVSKIRNLMHDTLHRKGYDEADIPFIIDMYLGGELRGHTSHGLASFRSFVEEDYSTLPKPEVIRETAALYFVDARSNPGVLVGKQAADEAIKRAQKEGVGTALIKNMDSWLRPGAIAEYVANQGLFTIVMNNGGGAAIAPPGGFDPVVSTNPIAYGIPTTAEPLVVDLATSKRAWGQVRLANKFGTALPADTFYDSSGKLTTDPKKAYSVLPMGDHKGFALALMIEVLCGSLVGMDGMFVNTGSNGSQFGNKMLERGGLIMVIDPAQTAGAIDFRSANTDLLRRINQTKPLAEQGIRVPGEQAGKLAHERIIADELEIPAELWEELLSL